MHSPKQVSIRKKKLRKRLKLIRLARSSCDFPNISSPKHPQDLGKAANFPYATINPEVNDPFICEVALKTQAQTSFYRFIWDFSDFIIPSDTCRSQEARIPVPDARFEWLCETYKPVSRVPAFLTCIDIAGLTAVRLN